MLLCFKSVVERCEFVDIFILLHVISHCYLYHYSLTAFLKTPSFERGLFQFGVQNVGPMEIKMKS
jgi:hypothetical protein